MAIPNKKKEEAVKSTQIRKEEYYKKEIDKNPYTPNDDEKKMIQDLYSRFDYLKRAKRDVGGINIEEVWDDAEMQLNGETGVVVDDEDERSNLFVPITWAIVDSINAEWMRQHTSGRVAPSEDPEDEPKAALVDLIRKYIENKNNVELVDMETNSFILGYGNGFQRIYYKEGKRKIKTATSVNDEGIVEYSEKIINDFDDIAIEDVNPRMLYPDDGAKNPDLSDCKDLIFRRVIGYAQFETEFGYLPNAKFVKRTGDTNTYDYYKKPKDVEDDDVEVLLWENKARDFHRTVANGVLLEDKPNPYDHKDLTFVGAGDNRRLGQFWWKGEPELIKSLQDEVNTHRSIRLDAQKMSTIKPIFASTSSRLEEEEIIVEPGKVYYFTGTIPPTEMQMNTDFSASFREEDRMREDIAGATGVDQRLEALSGDTTATESAIKKESTLKRIAKKIVQKQLMLEKKRGELIISLIMQYYTVPKMELIAGKEKISEYQNKDGSAKDGMTIMNEGGEQDGVYKEKYRRIRADNLDVKVKAERSPAGEVTGVKTVIREKKGYTFFDAKPELIKGKYDYVIVPDIAMPVTKAQEVDMSLALYDRLVNNPVINSPDGKMHIPSKDSAGNTVDNAMPMPKGILKLTENVLKKQGYNSEEYIPDETAGDPMLEQAMKENVAMMKGMQLGPTPLASPDHTLLHNKFMEGNVDDSMPEIKAIFGAHIDGELQFQESIVKEQRLKSGGANGQEPVRGTSGEVVRGGAGGNSGVPPVPSV